MSVFVSIVGNQIMAVLNPLLALQENRTPLEKIFLLHTVSTDPERNTSLRNAEKIKTFLKSHQVELKKVSQTLIQDENGNPPAPKVIEDIIDKNDRILFNIAGGLNFQIAACMQVINTEKTSFLYPESGGIHMFNLNGAVAKDKLIRLSKSEDVLKLLYLQEIPYKKLLDWGTRFPFHKLFKPCFGSDEQTICGTSLNGIQVGDVVFDRVYNNGNEFIFLKATTNETVDDIRNIINLANNRSDFGDLLHHKIVVVTGVPDLIERLKEESLGRVIVLNPEKDPCNTLKSIFRPCTYQHEDAVQVEYTETGEKVTSNASLYLALGTDLMPSLIALWSHAPKKVTFLYTPGNKIIESHKKNILDSADCLPCQEVGFLPTSITGTEILQSVPSADNPIEVNITPGTKGQSAMLSYFAKLNKGSVWSLYSTDLMRIDSSQRKKIVGPDINPFLRLNGVNAMCQDYKPNHNWHYQGIMKFLRLLLEQQRMGEFPREEIKLSDGTKFEITNRSKYNNTPLQGMIISGHEKCVVQLRNDAWFEYLIAFVMKSAGADEVKLNVTIPWSDTTQSILQKRLDGKFTKNGKRPQEISHRTEIDVVARFGSKFFLVSCKSGQVQKKKATAELKGVTPIFGRFAYPLLASLRHPINGDTECNGVSVIGFDTFSDVAKMKALLLKIEKEKKTTLR